MIIKLRSRCARCTLLRTNGETCARASGRDMRERTGWPGAPLRHAHSTSYVNGHRKTGGYDGVRIYDKCNERERERERGSLLLRAIRTGRKSEAPSPFRPVAGTRLSQLRNYKHSRETRPDVCSVHRRRLEYLFYRYDFKYFGATSTMTGRKKINIRLPEIHFTLSSSTPRRCPEEQKSDCTWSVLLYGYEDRTARQA